MVRAVQPRAFNRRDESARLPHRLDAQPGVHVLRALVAAAVRLAAATAAIVAILFHRRLAIARAGRALRRAVRLRGHVRRTSLLSRRDVSPDRFPTSWEGRKNGWETMVRTVAPAPRVGGGSKWADAQSQAMELKLANLPTQRRRAACPYHWRCRTMPPFCVDGHRLQVYGGQAYRGDRMRQGIMRREADARILPLSWSKPELIISGDPRISHCLEARCLGQVPECVGGLLRRR